MIPRTTASFVNIDDVLRYIGFSDNSVDEILDVIGSDVTWGDVTFTLVNNVFMLGLIRKAAAEGDIAPEDISKRYWEVVRLEDYINMEG